MGSPLFTHMHSFMMCGDAEALSSVNLHDQLIFIGL